MDLACLRSCGIDLFWLGSEIKLNTKIKVHLTFMFSLIPIVALEAFYFFIIHKCVGLPDVT